MHRVAGYRYEHRKHHPGFRPFFSFGGAMVMHCLVFRQLESTRDLPLVTGSALHDAGFASLLRRLLTSVAPSRHLTMPVALRQNNRSPGVIRATFLLMSVRSTSQRSGQVLGFNDIGRLTPLRRLICFLFVRSAFCLRLPSDPTSR